VTGADGRAAAGERIGAGGQASAGGQAITGGQASAGEQAITGGQASAGARTARRAQASQAVRRWRLPALLALGVLIAGGVIALLQQKPPPAAYLDPAGTGPTGAHALADLATERGQVVRRTTVPETAAQQSTGIGTLELITNPGQLTAAQLRQAAGFEGDILLVDPNSAALQAIAPRIGIAGHEFAAVVPPHCDLQAATLAGSADVDGAVLATSAPGAQECYPDGAGHWLVRYSSGSRTITVIGSGTPLTNQFLADDGNAALGLNLLDDAGRIVWVVPSGAPATAGNPGGQRSFFDLVPWPVYLIFIQLCVAVVLAAAWRGRRLGPLVAEQLPVVVRAAETTEGHGRLYHARRARERAAAELRAAAVGRLSRFAGLGLRGAGATRTGATSTGTSSTGTSVTGAHAAAAAAIAERAGLPAAEVTALLHGPPPATDQDLVKLAADLDQLERKIHQS
jgi:hypothetical protein